MVAGVLACNEQPPSAADVMVAALPSVVEILGSSGTGTGFVVSEGGLTVTNRHVVEGADRVLIRVSDGEVYLGRIIRTHPTLDLAYIQIEADRQFTPIAFGDSDEARVGSDVIAIGFPLGSELGREATITKGIISAKREAPSYLQTDAPLNPGNSGGPLLDEFGRVIGVNTARVSERDGRTITGINFAIPINHVKRDLEAGSLPRSLTVAITPTPTPTSALRPAATRLPAPQPIATPTMRTAFTPVPTTMPRPTATNTPTPSPTVTPTPIPPPTATPIPTPTPIPIRCDTSRPSISLTPMSVHEGKEPGEFLWHYPQSLGLWEGVSGTMVVDGIVYLHGLSAALDAVTGKLLWSNPGLSPVLSGDSFYVWTFDGDLQAVDARTGVELWTYDSKSPAGYAYSLAVFQGVVFTSWDGERMYALDATTGKLLWRSVLIEEGISTMSVATGGTVVFGGSTGHIYGLDAATGDIAWRLESKESRITRIGPIISPTPCNRVAFVRLSYGVSSTSSLWDHYLYAFDASTGKELWHSGPHDNIISFPIFMREIVYVGVSENEYYGGHSDYIYALSASTGESLWHFKISEPNHGGLSGNVPLPLFADIDDTVYVQHISENRIYRLNSLTGEVLWNYQPIAGPLRPYSIGASGGIAYLPTQRGLYAIDSSSDELLWRTEGYTRFFPKVANGIVYLTSREGVYAVKAEPPR